MFTLNMVAIFLVADPWCSALEIWKETKHTFFFFFLRPVLTQGFVWNVVYTQVLIKTAEKGSVAVPGLFAPSHMIVLSLLFSIAECFILQDVVLFAVHAGFCWWDNDFLGRGERRKGGGGRGGGTGRGKRETRNREGKGRGKRGTRKKEGKGRGNRGTRNGEGKGRGLLHQTLPLQPTRGWVLQC